MNLIIYFGVFFPKLSIPLKETKSASFKTRIRTNKIEIDKEMRSKTKIICEINKNY